MAATLKEELQVDAELIQGDGGVFDVVADGKLIFSKHAAGGFPREIDILAALVK